MSKRTKRNLLGGTLAGSLGVLVVALLAADPFSDASTRERPREIVLQARDLAFGGNNPTLHARPGERLRLRVRNDDPGVLHSISLPGIDPTVRQIPWGQEVVVEFTVPAQGSYEYVCPQHQPKMKGRIVVDGPAR
ncbi:MAG TPA: cupredoxin domain-containing protein [Candidatus Polarisedimenticolaceae bacterium]|nr:cupredoxin domain-containing protein [Candidatus Polarisedimenticolaceae bacterium]